MSNTVNVTQAYEILNDITTEVLGSEEILQEDLGNITEVGDDLIEKIGYDGYVKTLVDKVGKVLFSDDRVYTGGAPSIYKDSWEYGSMMQEIYIKTPEAVENESWDLVDGQEYNPNIFNAPTVVSKFYDKRGTFEIDMSFADRQIKKSFTSAGEVAHFIGAVENAIQRSFTIKMDGIVQRTLNNMIAETLYNECYDSATSTLVLTGRTGAKAVNLLYEYNQDTGSSLTADKCFTDQGFQRYAAYKVLLASNRLTKINTQFNIEGEDRFTPANMQNIVMLSDFVKATDVYLQSDTFHNELTKLPAYDEVPHWQSGDYLNGTQSSLKVVTAQKHAVEATGIVGCIGDIMSCAVTNIDRRTTAKWNPKGEFTNNFNKMDFGSFCNPAQNFVVFYVA